MKLVVFGLSVSSAWGNGHATTLRGLFRALERRGHEVVFFERDTPYYASHRDPPETWGCRLVLFTDWDDAARRAQAELAHADVAMVTSYCQDGAAVSDLVLSSNVGVTIFYDLDMPVTLERLKANETVDYIGPRKLADFDLVLSFTGGEALFSEASKLLGARKVIPLYGSVDPEVHRPVRGEERYRGALSYLGTYAADRHAQVDALYFEQARRMLREQFVLAGPLYPDGQRGGDNVRYFPHVAPSSHSSFYRSSELTLSVTRGAMRRYGYCPSGRLFESAASGAAIVSESFEGLSEFFEIGREILVADTTEEVMEAFERVRRGDGRLGERARRRAIEHHSADVRAARFEEILDHGGSS